MKHLRLLSISWVWMMIGLSGCSENPSEEAPTDSAMNWVVGSDIIRESTTSTSTILDGSTYRTYLLDFSLASVTSTDGVTFSSSVTTGINKSTGAEFFLRNPSALKTSSGTYLMIYEGVDESQHMKFFRATSTDGITFTRTTGALDEGAVMVPSDTDNNFISVPDMLEVDGTIHLYYVCGGNRSCHATSTDEGNTWTKTGELTLSGISTSDKVVDPDVVLLPNGQFWLFFAYTKEENSSLGFGKDGILSALSSDGFTFTVESDTALTTAGEEHTYDPDVFLMPGETDKYRMLFGYGETADASAIDLKTATYPE